MRPDERMSKLAGPLGEAEQALVANADARHKRLTAENVRAITEHVLSGMSFGSACNAAGVPTSTFRYWVENRHASPYQEVVACFEAARALNERVIADEVLRIALSAERDSDRLNAAKFWLTSRNPREWSVNVREAIAEEQQRWMDLAIRTFREDPETLRAFAAALEASTA